MRKVILALAGLTLVLSLSSCDHNSVLRHRGGQPVQAPPAQPVSPPCVFQNGCE